VLAHEDLYSTHCPGFVYQTDPTSFFRPGQIFTAQIASTFYLQNDRNFRQIDFGNLPLEPIPKLKNMAESERLEDRTKRLAQIRQLPLDQMTHYCKNLPLETEKVECLLCPSEWNHYPRDQWATHHFRIDHWRQYFGIIPNGSHLFRGFSRQKIDEIIPWEKQKLPQRASDSRSSRDEWIVLEDVIADNPIDSDEDLVSIVANTSEIPHYLAGPVMIRRFVVVGEGDGYCLCVGIHTSVNFPMSLFLD
jgi:hypothetical protein